MRVLTIAGTRPELIRLSVIINKLDKLVDHVLVFTNQNYTASLSTVFFDELRIRNPDYIFKPQSGFSKFLGNALIEFEEILKKEKPDKILILGDTNSGLLSILANRNGIPIIHMEAGNRCFNDLVPEEGNRKIIDSLSTYNLPYTDNSKQNLLNEGYHKNKVFKIGNPILEVLNYYKKDIDSSDILDRLALNKQTYVLVTAHRAENVDNLEVLSNIVNAINTISKTYKVLFSVHPRTKDKIIGSGLTFTSERVILSEPLGFFDFVNLEKNSKMVISDSGTVTEETCLFGIHSIIIRESTERQELIECGSSILTGTKYENMLDAFNILNKRSIRWFPPSDYLVENVSDIVINIILGK